MLPSQRLLRDYTHHTKAAAGFSASVDRQLMESAQTSDSSEMEKCVFLLMDEMHIKEDIVYDKHSGMLSKCIIIHVLCRAAFMRGGDIVCMQPCYVYDINLQVQSLAIYQPWGNQFSLGNL